MPTKKAVEPDVELMSVDAIAQKWEVSPKTVENWIEVVFLGFDIVLPKPEMPLWGVALIEFIAKHISQKANLYFRETGERRRLKAAEVIAKIHQMREAGHFPEFEQFRQATISQPQDDDDLEMIAELGAIARERKSETSKIIKMLEEAEDQQVEDVATFIETSDQRKQSKLARRLATRKRPELSTGDAIDTSFRRLPGS